MTQLIHLQAIGKVPAKPAKQFRKGKIMMWNYGYRSKVLAIIDETPNFLVFAIRDDMRTPEGRNESYTKRLKKNRLVAIG